MACGNGYLSRRLARLGAKVTEVDAYAPVVERARAREARDPLGITYHVADATNMDLLKDASFDLVVTNTALMDTADVRGALREASRVLRYAGRFVASLFHPCSDVGNASAWVIEKIGLTTKVWRKVGAYREPFED